MRIGQKPGPASEALELAIAAASRAVTIEGPQGGVATVEAIEQFRAEFARREARSGRWGAVAGIAVPATAIMPSIVISTKI